MCILTFEPDLKGWIPDELLDMKERLANEGITWYYLPYHKWPSVPATLYDVVRGAIFAWKMVRSNKIDILHGRIHVPTLMAIIAKKLSFGKVKVLFDIRGLMPEEYTEGGMWKSNGMLFRSVKRVERWLLDNSDGFIVLTEKAREIFFPESKETGCDKHGRPVEVIPCCVDLERFGVADWELRSRIRDEMKLNGNFVIAYVGSFGSDWYMPREISDFLGVAKRRKHNTFAMVLTQTSPELIRPLLRSQGFSDAQYFIEKVSPAEIPRYLSAADVAVSFIRPCYSKLGSSPTKNAEYLAAGLPIVTNSGVGDTAELTRSDNVGVVIDEFTTESYEEALDSIDQLLSSHDIADRCRTSAANRFDLRKIAGERYRRVYKTLLEA